jgi:hypothetical protein
MIFNLIQSGITFVESNIILVGMIMSIVAYVRLILKVYTWCQAWMITAIAFLLAFIFAVPASGFALSPEYIIQGFMLGLSATGIYKTGSAIAEKAKDL